MIITTIQDDDDDDVDDDDDDDNDGDDDDFSCDVSTFSSRLRALHTGHMSVTNTTSIVALRVYTLGSSQLLDLGLDG